jgi:hypothetical protein
MFLLYINDIGEKIGSSVRLFADDSLIYMAAYKAEVGLSLDICGTSA